MKRGRERAWKRLAAHEVWTLVFPTISCWASIHRILAGLGLCLLIYEKTWFDEFSKARADSGKDHPFMWQIGL